MNPAAVCRLADVVKFAHKLDAVEANLNGRIDAVEANLMDELTRITGHLGLDALRRAVGRGAAFAAAARW